MTSSLSFDQAADFYDRTRELPPEVATRGIEAILQRVPSGGLLLDVGTGTGRLSVPLLQKNANLIGCDLSRSMMARLQAKYASARLAQADAAALPFPGGTFDAVLTCHVMHLVGPWQEALREYRRILKPDGAYINARTDEAGAPSAGQQTHEHWKALVKQSGWSTRRPGVEDDDELRAALRALGATVVQVEVLRTEHTSSVARVLQRITDRIDSQTWNLPDDVLVRTVEETREWAAQEFGDLEAMFREEAIFSLDVARFANRNSR